MTITSSDKYTILIAETDFNTFFKDVSKTFTDINNQNIVLDTTDINITEEEINSLDKFAEIQAENNQSFAIVVSSFDADAFDETLNVVPTLTEAEDIIDMDEMTRDLGF